MTPPRRPTSQLRRRPARGALIVGVVCLVCWATACDSKGQDTSETSPTYTARCRIEIESAAEPTMHTASGRGADADDAELAGWAALCAQLGLDAGCQDALPDGLAQAGVACMGLSNVEGTGIRLADPNTHDCTVNIRDRRAIRTGQAEVIEEGSASELEDYADVLCAQAIAEACAQVGAEGDCTAGEEPAYRVVLRNASRRLGRGGP